MDLVVRNFAKRLTASLQNANGNIKSHCNEFN